MTSAKFMLILKSTHPIPSVAVGSFCMIVAIGIGLDFSKVIGVSLAILFQQLSVGLSNDWLDLDRDLAAKRKDKPLVSGELSSTLVRNCALLAAIISIIFSFTLGLIPALLIFPGLLVGWAYNLGMKSNWSSVIPYAIGFGMLPIFVLSVRGTFTSENLWTVAVASLLGVSAHFANVLPDLIADRRTGVRSLPHILGQEISALVITTTAVAASAIIVAQAKELEGKVAWFGFGLTCLLALTASILSLKPNPPRIIFPLLLLASLVNVVLLMLGL